jgi:hypothetical protein
VEFTPKNLNKFLLFKLPSAFFTGVRVESISDKAAIIRVKHRWISQNPFNSLYYGVQAMAAELSTGVLVLKQIAESHKKISMLVTHQTASFTKKGRGIIRFSCDDGDQIKKAINQTLETGEGQTFKLKSIGLNEKGEQVSIFEFEWSIKKK